MMDAFGADKKLNAMRMFDSIVKWCIGPKRTQHRVTDLFSLSTVGKNSEEKRKTFGLRFKMGQPIAYKFYLFVLRKSNGIMGRRLRVFTEEEDMDRGRGRERERERMRERK